MKRIKAYFVLFQLLMLSVFASAQEQKYEFATIYYYNTNLIAISITGQPYSEEVITLLKKEVSNLNTVPLLAKVAEFQNKGWEVMSFDFGGLSGNMPSTHVAYLKRKIN